MCLLLNIAADELASPWIKGDLTRSIHELSTTNGLTIGANSGGSVRSMHFYKLNLFHVKFL